MVCDTCLDRFKCFTSMAIGSLCLKDVTTAQLKEWESEVPHGYVRYQRVNHRMVTLDRYTISRELSRRAPNW